MLCIDVRVVSDSLCALCAVRIWGALRCELCTVRFMLRVVACCALCAVIVRWRQCCALRSRDNVQCAVRPSVRCGIAYVRMYVHACVYARIYV